MINSKLTRVLFFSILFSIFLPAGILLIVFNGGHTSMLAIGIVLCVLGFYGCPMLWVNYGDLKTKKSICNQISLDSIQEIDTLAEINNQQPQQMLKTINDLISKRYLTGYEIVDGKYIVPKQNRTLSKNEILEKNGQIETLICPSCGAKVEVIGTNSYCPYCNTVVKK